MRNDVSRLISQQRILTTLIAQALANSNNLGRDLVNNNIHRTYFSDLITNLKTDSIYKHIWIQVVDKHLHSVYRSWSKHTGDDLSKIRKDLQRVKRTKKRINSISVGRFTISIKAMVPILKNGKLIGVIEVVSHFTPIVRQLDKSSISSIVLVDKQYQKRLLYAPKDQFLDGYFIADTNMPRHVIDLLQKNGVLKYCTDTYRLEHNNISTCYKLKDINSSTIGYFIMFQKRSYTSDMHFKYFTFKWIVFNVIAFITLLLLASISLYYKSKRQKQYYQKITDLSSNVIIIADRQKILEVNKTFYNYFHSDIRLEDVCVANFFVKEKGYLQEYVDGLFWIDYIIKHQDKTNKIKIKVDDQIYYFLASASLISQDNSYYSVVLTDITNEERYQQNLKHLTITDTLTNIKNRYYFNKAIQEEIQRASRYEYPISLIMFDIDFFKLVNDKYGHDTGDEVLIEYTKLVNSMLRKNDTFCRIGGEEFMIIAPYANLENAVAMAQKMRRSVQKHKKVVPITMSFGVVQYQNNEEIEHLLKRVDNALYKAKENGRNCVVEG
jgi:diguanylate cyclase